MKKDNEKVTDENRRNLLNLYVSEVVSKMSHSELIYRVKTHYYREFKNCTNNELETVIDAESPHLYAVSSLITAKLLVVEFEDFS